MAVNVVTTLHVGGVGVTPAAADEVRLVVAIGPDGVVAPGTVGFVPAVGREEVVRPLAAAEEVVADAAFDSVVAVGAARESDPNILGYRGRIPIGQRRSTTDRTTTPTSFAEP